MSKAHQTLVNIGGISDWQRRTKGAKTAFYNFESGAFNHSATLPLAWRIRLFSKHRKIAVGRSDTAFPYSWHGSAGAIIGATQEVTLGEHQLANLIRYEPSGTYFARVRVGGKLIR